MTSCSSARAQSAVARTRRCVAWWNRVCARCCAGAARDRRASLECTSSGARPDSRKTSNLRTGLRSRKRQGGGDRRRYQHPGVCVSPRLRRTAGARAGRAAGAVEQPPVVEHPVAVRARVSCQRDQRPHLSATGSAGGCIGGGSRCGCRPTTSVCFGEASTHFDRLCGLIGKGKITGPQIHDARIAAICLDHGVSELWTADRDYLRFPSLCVRNPLSDPA